MHLHLTAPSEQVRGGCAKEKKLQEMFRQCRERTCVWETRPPVALQ